MIHIYTSPDARQYEHAATVRDGELEGADNMPTITDDELVDEDGLLRRFDGPYVLATKVEPNATSKAWVPYEGPRGGEGWRNTDDGEVRYQTEPPGETAGSSPEDEPLSEGDTVLLDYHGEPRVGRVWSDSGSGVVHVIDNKKNTYHIAPDTSEPRDGLKVTNLGRGVSERLDPVTVSLDNKENVAYALDDLELSEAADWLVENANEVDPEVLADGVEQSDQPMMVLAGRALNAALNNHGVDGVQQIDRVSADGEQQLDAFEALHGREARETVEAIQGAWSASSRGSMYKEPAVAPMVKLAIARTGNRTLPGARQPDRYESVMESVINGVSADQYRHAKAMKEYTVDKLKEAFGDEITLFRGLRDTDGDGGSLVDALESAKKTGESVAMEHRPLESWTYQPATAFYYGDAVIKRTVPTDSVMASSLVATISPLENEVVVEHEPESEVSPEDIVLDRSEPPGREVSDEAARQMFELRMDAIRGLAR